MTDEPRTYVLETFNDMANIPLESFDDFLKDLKSWREYVEKMYGDARFEIYMRLKEDNISSEECELLTLMNAGFLQLKLGQFRWTDDKKIGGTATFKGIPGGTYIKKVS